MKRIGVGLVLVLIVTCLGAYGLLKLEHGTSLVSANYAAEKTGTGQQVTGTLTVSGVGEIRVNPDIAHVQFGVENKGETAKQAQEANNQVMAAIIQQLGQIGVEKEKIQTEHFSLYPEYSYNRESGISTLVGYRAVNQVQVEVEDVQTLGEIIDTAIGAGANQIVNVTYGVRNTSEFAHMALELAVENAMTKANVIADAAGVRIGGVQKIVDSGVQTGGVQLLAEQVRTMKASDTGAALAPGQVTVTSRVQMVLYLE